MDGPAVIGRSGAASVSPSFGTMALLTGGMPPWGLADGPVVVGRIGEGPQRPQLRVLIAFSPLPADTALAVQEVAPPCALLHCRGCIQCQDWR